MFIECIVKNRGAIAEPWREFRTEGNSYFLFSLMATVCLMLLAALLSARWFIGDQRAFYLSLHEIVSSLCVVDNRALGVRHPADRICLGTGREFHGARHVSPRCRAYEAFRAATSLIARHPGEIVLYCLFLIVLAVASVMMGCVATCATCCIAAIPYVGTVILLPVFVLLRSFSLLFLRQFGPEYDVWASFTPPEYVRILSPHIAPPLPPLLDLPPQPPPSPPA